jgi:hypothetical protein
MLEDNTNKSWSKFEAEEIKAAELNDEELDAVAGGGLRTWAKKVGKASWELVKDVLD